MRLADLWYESYIRLTVNAIDYEKEYRRKSCLEATNKEAWKRKMWRYSQVQNSVKRTIESGFTLVTTEKKGEEMIYVYKQLSFIPTRERDSASAKKTKIINGKSSISLYGVISITILNLTLLL